MQVSPSNPNHSGRWFAVAAWSLLIFVTVPIADRVQSLIAQTTGRDAFLYAVVAVTGAATVGAIVHLYRTHRTNPLRIVLLSAIGAAFAAAAFSLRANPEESAHFVEYGVLCGLAYRAFAARMPNAASYLGAFLCAACVGLIDEALQWITPGRYWELRDIGINMAAVSLTLAAIMLGIAPTNPIRRLGRRGARSLVRWAAVATALLAASMLNTPARIAWYSSKLPVLAPLAQRESAMFEYGYYFHDPETGSFKSRLPPRELADADRRRGAEVGNILDRHRDPETYAEFLRRYSPVTDPFVHEVRVHLFRRDRYIERAANYAEGSEDHRYRVTVAYSEDQILRKYFQNTLAHSGFELPAAQVEYLRSYLLPGHEHESAVARSESAVSRSLVTAVTERQLIVLFLVLFAALFCIDRRIVSGLHGRAGRGSAQ